MAISDGEYWTSGSDLSCPNEYSWCSRGTKFRKGQVPWKSGHPDANAGECVYAEIRNGSVNETLLATSTCGKNLSYICETRKKGTEFQGLTFECMDLWDVSEGLTCIIKGLNISYIDFS
jgi:hypothetical protein